MDAQKHENKEKLSLKKSFSLIACKLIIRKNLAEGAHIKEWDYYTPSGEFRVDGDGSPTLLNCMMYKIVNHIPQISPVVKVVSYKLYLRWIYFVHSPNQTLPRILHKRKQQPHGANKTLSALKEPI